MQQPRLCVAVLACALAFVTSAAEARRGHHHRHHWATYSTTSVMPRSSGMIVAHPAGCPRRAFCGCGVSDYIYGRSVRSLWPSRAWLRFPRAMAGPGMVAYFGHGHVAAIIATHGDGTATLYDPNSGGHATRIHRRDISRATIVNPRG